MKFIIAFYFFLRFLCMQQFKLPLSSVIVNLLQMCSSSSGNVSFPFHLGAGAAVSSQSAWTGGSLRLLPELLLHHSRHSLGLCPVPDSPFPGEQICLLPSFILSLYCATPARTSQRKGNFFLRLWIGGHNRYVPFSSCPGYFHIISLFLFFLNAFEIISL